MPLDPDAQILLDAMIKANRPAFETLTPVQARQQMREIRALLKQPVPEVAEVRDLTATGPHGEIPVRLYRAKAVKPGDAQPALVFLSWRRMGVRRHRNPRQSLPVACQQWRLRGVVGRLSACTRTQVSGRRRRLLGGLHLDAMRMRLDSSIDPTRLAVGGDSAGGNLAAVVAMLAQRSGGPRVRCQILLYPTVDLAMNTDSYRQLGTGYNLTAAAMEWFRGLYLNSASEVTDWRASPLLATNIAGLPPAYVAVAGCDPLHDEGVAFAKLLERNGVPVTFRDFPGQMHGFASMSGFLKAADEVIADVGAALKKNLATA